MFHPWPKFHCTVLDAQAEKAEVTEEKEEEEKEEELSPTEIRRRRLAAIEASNAELDLD